MSTIESVSQRGTDRWKGQMPRFVNRFPDASHEDGPEIESTNVYQYRALPPAYKEGK